MCCSPEKKKGYDNRQMSPRNRKAGDICNSCCLCCHESALVLSFFSGVEAFGSALCAWLLPHH